MKNLSILMAILTVLFVLPVAKKYLTGDEINGSSRKAAYISAKKVKTYLPPEERMVFDFAFGILEELKTAEGGEKLFLDTVGGLTPEEVIATAKKEVTARIAAHDGKFTEFQSWEDMLKKLTSDNKALRAMRERQQGSM
jgi:hypothetical protein